MKEKSEIRWRDTRRKPEPFVSVLGLLSDDPNEQYPRVRECFYVPASERENLLMPEKTDEDYFEPQDGFWFPAFRTFLPIVKWAQMPDPIAQKEEDDDF